MVELFAQVWFLCVVAFLAGAAVTWLVFVRAPHRLPAPRPPAATGSRRPDRPLAEPRHARRAPAPLRPVEPALANLDTHRGEVRARHAGSAAAGALDRLGVAGPGHLSAPPLPAPEIPTPADPVDAPPPRSSGRPAPPAHTPEG